MPCCIPCVRRVGALGALFALVSAPMGAQGDGGSLRYHAAAEALHYSIEWRLIDAGEALLKIQPEPGEKQPRWQATVELQSAGLVSRLYKLDDKYSVRLEDQFCAASSELNALEGKKHRDTKVTYDGARKRATYVERDLVKNTIAATKETEIPACVSDVIGGFYKLRTMHLEPGQSVQIATSDGKKTAQVRIEAQEREEIKNHLGMFKTIRYEAYIFNGVIYAKKARLLIWLTDDAQRLPVQIRARMPFPIGSITLELEKEEHS